MGNLRIYCWKCSKEIETVHKVSRSQTCPQCQSYLHCCYNCKFYDKFAHNECKEPQAEWVKDKSLGNFCDYFLSKQDKPSAQKSISKEEANKKIAELLKKKNL